MDFKLEPILTTAPSASKLDVFTELDKIVEIFLEFSKILAKLYRFLLISFLTLKEDNEINISLIAKKMKKLSILQKEFFS
jgi:hypothetical protein